jgi:hypothetical protein
MTAVTQHDLFRCEHGVAPYRPEVRALLEDLRAEGIAAPADATAAMALLHECSEHYTGPTCGPGSPMPTWPPSTPRRS